MRSLTLLLIVGPLLSLAPAQQAVKVSGLPKGAPLAITATATSEELALEVAMNPEWHLYASDVGGGIPVSVTVADTCAFRAAGPLKIPETIDGKLVDSFTLSLPLKSSGAGNALQATFAFMACDPLQCLPPMSVTLSGEVSRDASGLRVLLVADGRDDRADRIVKLLGRSGLATTVTTYGEVTKPLCDAHDVVLADSKLFRENAKGSYQKAKVFPATDTPIVAVGFLGTVLIEEQGVAMTSGYI